MNQKVNKAKRSQQGRLAAAEVERIQPAGVNRPSRLSIATIRDSRCAE